MYNYISKEKSTFLYAVLVLYDSFSDQLIYCGAGKEVLKE